MKADWQPGELQTFNYYFITLPIIIIYTGNFCLGSRGRCRSCGWLD
jgi:hypothetical protein